MNHPSLGTGIYVVFFFLAPWKPRPTAARRISIFPGRGRPRNRRNRMRGLDGQKLRLSTKVGAGYLSFGRLTKRNKTRAVALRCLSYFVRFLNFSWLTVCSLALVPVVLLLTDTPHSNDSLANPVPTTSSTTRTNAGMNLSSNFYTSRLIISSSFYFFRQPSAFSPSYDFDEKHW